MRLLLLLVGCVLGCSPPPPAEPPPCESTLDWGRGGALMFPGTNCQSCHTRGGRASAFTAGGTVFTSPTCPTPAAGAIVTITDANRKTISLPVNEAGNFFTAEPLALPFRVIVESDDGRREMKRSTAGDCNYCHQPTDGGPGPLTVP